MLICGPLCFHCSGFGRPSATEIGPPRKTRECRFISRSWVGSPLELSRESVHSATPEYRPNTGGFLAVRSKSGVRTGPNDQSFNLVGSSPQGYFVLPPLVAANSYSHWVGNRSPKRSAKSIALE